MKVYTKIVIDMETLQVEESEWTEYYGPIWELKGGGGGGDTVDKKYNKGMLAISEDQQDIANQMFNFFKYGVEYDPTQQIKSQEWKDWKDGGKQGPEPKKYTGQTKGDLQGYDPDSVVSEMEFMQQQLAAQSELLPFQTSAAKEQLKTIEQRQGLTRSIYEDALRGVDVEGRVDTHRAGVQHAFKNEQGIATRNMNRLGIDPSSGRGAAAFENIGLEKAKATAGGETAIRKSADDENFARKASAAGLPV